MEWVFSDHIYKPFRDEKQHQNVQDIERVSFGDELHSVCYDMRVMILMSQGHQQDFRSNFWGTLQAHILKIYSIKYIINTHNLSIMLYRNKIFKNWKAEHVILQLL